MIVAVFKWGRSVSHRGWPSALSPPACLILHATGIISIDHGCRSVCRWLHRSVSLITHSYSSSGRRLLLPRPLLLCLPSCSFHTHSLPLLSPCLLLYPCSISHLLPHTHFLIRQKSKSYMNIHKESTLICTIMQISTQLRLVSPESLDSISA